MCDLGEFTEAEPLLRECLTSREKTQPDAWTTFPTRSMFGWALLGQKKYAEAEPLLLKGYESMEACEKTIPQNGGGELRISEAIGRLIELYTATEESDEVAKWMAQRAKHLAPSPLTGGEEVSYRQRTGCPEASIDPTCGLSRPLVRSTGNIFRIS